MDSRYYKDFFILEKTHWLFKVRRKIFLYFINFPFGVSMVLILEKNDDSIKK